MVRAVPSFCPHCGVELVEREFEGRDRRYCRACGEYVWRDPGPCAAVAVVDGERVLLVERAIDPWRGMWDFPAGFIEVDEHPRDGAVRELREETGLVVDPGDLSLVRTATYRRTEAEHVLLVLFSVPRSATDGEVVPSEEASAARFFSPEEFDRSGESMIPPVRGLFDRVATERP